MKSFWAPMSIVFIGELELAAYLGLFFVPVLSVWWYGVKETDEKETWENNEHEKKLSRQWNRESFFACYFTMKTGHFACLSMLADTDPKRRLFKALRPRLPMTMRSA